MTSLLVGPVNDILDGESRAMPARNVLLTWQAMDGATSLLGSNDGTNFSEIDAATSQYEVRSLETSAAFIQVDGGDVKITARA